MEIIFKTSKLEKILNDQRLIQKHYGTSSRKIQSRLDDLRNVENLAEVFNLPGGHHPLTGDRQGQFSCYLEHPFRLIYEPANDPLPYNEQHSLIYKAITIVAIIEIKDYH